jgi:hypothetical protein
MGLYSDKIMQMVDQIGKPLKSTSTTTATADEGLDLGPILMMLMMKGMFKGPSTKTPVEGNLPDSSMASNALLGGLANQAPGSFPSTPYSGGGGSGGLGGGINSATAILQLLQQLGALR